jgi:hypothetical protein
MPPDEVANQPRWEHSGSYSSFAIYLILCGLRFHVKLSSHLVTNRARRT